jgi:hypothetical protein
MADADSKKGIFFRDSGKQAIRTRRRKFDNLRAQLENERVSFESHWRELGDHILPRRTRFFLSDVNRGDRRTRKIIDSTATLAVRTLAAGMMGGVTSPARPWFRLSTPDPELAEDGAVKIWLNEVARLMRAVFLKSNLYQALPTLYKDMGTFATAAMFLEEDFDTTIRAFPLPVGSYMLANNDRLQIRVFFREFRMTVRQLIEKFGVFDDKGEVTNWENFSETVFQSWRNDRPEDWIDVCHIIAPNENHDPEKLESKFKKYISVYYEKGASDNASNRPTPFDDDRFLRERGYDQFPVLAARWETTGEDVYGTDCPGMTALGDIKQLQLGEKRLMQAIEKMVNPPMKGPSHLKTLKASILPGDITYSDEREGQGGFRPVHEVDPRIQEMEGKQEQVRGRIRRAFFEDLFLLLASSDRREITAREVDERHEEKLLALGSVLEQLNQDVLDPLIDLTFDYMLRQGQIPEPPDELKGIELRVEYISIMAQAQKLAGLAGIERFAGFVVNMAQTDPAVLDKLNRDQLIDEYAEITGVPPNLVVDDEEVAEIRAQRQQAAQAAQAAEVLQQGAGAVKDLANAKMGEDSALDRLAERAAAGQGAAEEEVA